MAEIIKLMTKLSNFLDRWTDIDEVDGVVQVFSEDHPDVVVEINRDDILSQFRHQQITLGLIRVGWDQYNEETDWESPEDRWLYDRNNMISEAWDRVKKVFKNADGEILKIAAPWMA